MKSKINGSNKNVGSIEEDMRYFIQDIDILINNIINMQEYTATGIVAVKQPLILKIYSFLNDYKRLQKENEELLEVKISASVHNRIMELEKENKLLLNLKNGVDLSFDDYIPISLVEETIEELDEELEIMKVDAMYGRYKEYGSKLSFEKQFSYKYGMHDILQELLEKRKYE